MKSIEYFQHGLPIINDIPEDTAEMVVKYDAGIYFYNGINLNNPLLSDSNFEKGLLSSMKEKAIALYNEQFSIDAFYGEMESIS